MAHNVSCVLEVKANALTERRILLHWEDKVGNSIYQLNILLALFSLGQQTAVESDHLVIVLVACTIGQGGL